MIFLLTWPSYTAFRQTDVPLFVNREALFGSRSPKRLPRARGLWAIDSGGFMALRKHGVWPITHEQYVKEVRRCVAEIGAPLFAPCMDWMCEDVILEKTGKSVEEHQWLTIDSYLRLRHLAPELNHLWSPVLQGRDPKDYVDHFMMYLAHGVDLRRVNTVGVGSVCRRWVGSELARIFEQLHELGLRRLHGFGAKEESFDRTGTKTTLKSAEHLFYDDLFHRALERGLEAEWLLHPETGVSWEESEVSTCRLMASADSAAWSTRARNQALEVWLARQEHAKRLGHEPERVRESGYCRDARGVVYYGTQEIGRVLLDRAETRVGAVPLETAVLLPTQIMPECARNTAAGIKGKLHVSCNMCALWALEYRRRLQAAVDPYGCWEETPGYSRLPTVPFEEEQARRIARTRELRDKWETGWRP